MMKNLFSARLRALSLVVSVFSCVSPVFAQWATTGNDIYNTNSGVIGIGTSSPAPWASAYKTLDLFGYGFLYGSSNGTNFGPGAGQTGWGNNTYFDGSNSKAINTGAASLLAQGTGYLVFATAPSVSAGATQTFTEAFIITSSGNVGIGTSSPTTRIHVQGDNPAINVENINASAGAGSSLVFGHTQSSSTTGLAKLYTYLTDGSSSGRSGHLIFQTASGGALADRMIITNGGNVGIGTNDPQGYKLAVNGSMIATSVKVKAYANWPDYVFAPEHRLRSLGELERYIRTNRHLPDLPSAEEVKREGIDLADMNARLLRKIEELTLYLLEKDKELDQQARANASLESRMKLLESRLDALAKPVRSR